MTTDPQAPEATVHDEVTAAMDAALAALQDLATALQQPVLMTIFEDRLDPEQNLERTSIVRPWCGSCQRHH